MPFGKKGKRHGIKERREGRMLPWLLTKRGKPTSNLEIIGDTKETGTKITFKADPEIFDVTVYDKHTLENRFREMAFLNKGVRLIFEDKRDGSEVEFKYDGGIKEFVEYLNRTKDPIMQTVPHFIGNQEDTEIEITLP